MQKSLPKRCHNVKTRESNSHLDMLKLIRYDIVLIYFYIEIIQ